MTHTLLRRRSWHRFWRPVDGRYFRYARPALVDAVCPRCDHRLTFSPELPEPPERGPDRGYPVIRGEVEGPISGRGGCGGCGHIVRRLNWPDDAYFKVELAGGHVWAWNDRYLPVLRARVAGDKVAVRQLTLGDWELTCFIARLPRYALLARHRVRLIAEFDRLESKGSTI
jgi:hypothetical protein